MDEFRTQTKIASAASCQRCGAALSPDAPEGLCASCLLSFGVTGFKDELADFNSASSLPEKSRRSIGDYELISEIARGGMGVVYRARQRSLNRIVALKMIGAGQFARPAEIQRFRTEAEAAARLQHPNIVAIHEVGEHDGHPYYSMDCVEGKSLAELARDHPLSIARAAQYVKIIAEATHYAHSKGILHRDLKPSNILIDEAGQPRITDFGLAKVMAADSALTISGAALGSPSYMPPEQASSKRGVVSVRSDVYSLGAILYELLSGCPPFQSGTPAETLNEVLENDPVPLSLLKPSVPRDLETICLKCLQKSPERRYSSAAALADELGRFLRDEPILARPATRTEKFWRWCRRQPALAGSLAAVLALLAVVALGSTVFALRVSKAEREANEKLWISYLEQARSGRLSGVAGRRAKSLSAIAAAAKMRPSLELRNEAIACLALTDLEPPVRLRESSLEASSDVLLIDAAFARYAVLHQHGGVTIRSVEHDRVLSQFPAPSHRGAAGVFSPDGRYLAANFPGGRIFLWDLSASPPLAQTNFPVVRDSDRAATFTPDSRTFAVVGKDRVVHLYDLVTGQEQSPIPLGITASRMEFDPSGRMLAVMSFGEVQLWNVPQRERAASLTRRARGTKLRWHPAGRHLAAGFNNGELWLWDTETGEERLLAGHEQHIEHIAFDPVGELLIAVGWDGTAKVWDPTLGRSLFAMRRRGQAYRFSPDGQRLAIFREQGGLEVARVIRSNVYRQFTSAKVKQPRLSGVDVSPNGRWLAFGERSGRWHLWELSTRQELGSAVGGAWPKFHPDGQSVITVSSNGVLQWPLDFSADTGGVTIGPGKELVSITNAEFQRAEISRDGDLMAVVGQNQSVMLHLRNPSRQVPFATGSRQHYVTISPDKRFVAAATFYGEGVTIWNAQSGNRVAHLITNENAQVAFSPDGRVLATATPRECCWWDTETWRVRWRMPLDLAGDLSVPVSFSADGQLFAIAVDQQQIKLLDARDGRELATLTPPELFNIEPLVFSGDGRYLVAGSLLRVAPVWNLHALRRELAAMNLDW